MVDTLKQSEQKYVKLLFCGDFTSNYFIEHHKKKLSQSLMNTYNLIQVTEFPTSICKIKGLLIDNIFLVKRGHGSHRVYPASNGLSDHDAQILIPGNLQSLSQHIIYKSKLRIINIETITNFQSRNAVYKAYNDNSKYNLFLNTFLTIYEKSFQTVYKIYEHQ